MTLGQGLYAIALLVLVYVGIDRYWPRTITEATLVDQLAGAHCRFAFELDRCEQRGFDPLRSLLTESHDCDMWAVQCLMGYKSPKAVDVMINVLSTKTDVQTCDGVRPVRTYAVEYLGNSGDLSALPPLKKLLASNPTETLSAGASGCRAGSEKLETIRVAIDKLEGR
jgi:hypothetical protein